MSAPEQYIVIHESPMGLYDDGTVGRETRVRRHQDYPDCRCGCYGCKFTCAAHRPLWRRVLSPSWDLWGARKHRKMLSGEWRGRRG